VSRHFWPRGCVRNGYSQIGHLERAALSRAKAFLEIVNQPAAKFANPLRGASNQQKAIAALVALLFVVLAVAGFRLASGETALATLTQMDGGAKRDTADSIEDWITAEVGDEFTWGDGARTEKKQSANFRLTTGAKLTLKPSSQIRFQRSHEQGGLGIQVDVGEADIETTEGELTLDSDFGPIIVSPNSTITMRREGDQIVVGVELGQVKLGKERRVVETGEEVGLELGGIVVDVPVAESEPPAPEEPDEEPEEEEEPLNVGNGVPHADLVVSAGDNFTVHDPTPPTAVGFRVGGVCDGPALLKVGKLKTEAKGQANLPLPRGRHKYEVRCLDTPESVAASGAVSVLRDAGTKQLPSFTPSASVATDGRRYTVMYQYRLPKVTVTWPTAPQASSYTLTVGGRTIKTTSPSYTFKSLRAGTHRAVFSAASTPPRKSRTTTISVVYDSQAPAARVSEPASGYAPGAALKISGQALPGWKVSVDGNELEVDSQRRFSSEHTAKGALPIAFSHPTHGMHYYLRRPQASAQ